MTLDHINRWLALFANAGVIAGIIFLALELRQNNELLELEAARAVEDRRKSTIDVVLSNPAYLEMMVKDERSLTALEKDQLTLVGIRILLDHESLYEDMLRGSVDEAYARRVIREVYWRPRLNYGARIAWPTYKSRADPDFVAWMEQNVVRPGPIE